MESRRWDDVLRISLPGEEEVALVAELDSTGDLAWRPTTDEVGEHLRRKRWIVAMLNDSARNAAYAAALSAAAAEARNRAAVHSEGGGAVVALDIGAGTGLLSLLAAQHCDHVVALEMEPAMVNIARQNFASPGEVDVSATRDAAVAERITLVNAHSTEVDLPFKAALVMSEIVDHFLIGEGIIPAVRDALQRLAAPNAVVVPCAATVYCRLAHVEGARGARRPQTGSAVNWIPVRAAALEGLRWLSDTVTAVDLRFDTLESLPQPGEVRRANVSVPATANGTANVVVWWWSLELFDGIRVSNAPGAPWQDHWLQVSQRLDDIDCVAGVAVDLEVRHDETAITFTRAPAAAGDDATLCGCSWHVWPTQQRRDALPGPRDQAVLAAHLLDRRRLPEAARGRQLAVFDVCDGGACALVAACSESGVSAVAVSADGRDALLVAQLARANGVGDRVAVVAALPRSRADLVAALRDAALDGDEDGNDEGSDGGPPLAVVICGEPWYVALEGQPIWTALRFWRRARAVHALLSAGDAAIVSPGAAHVECVVVASPQLRAAYANVAEDVLCHGPARRVWRTAREKYFVAFDGGLDTLYDTSPATADAGPLRLATFDFQNDPPLRIDGSVVLRPTGRIDAVAVSVRYDDAAHRPSLDRLVAIVDEDGAGPLLFAFHLDLVTGEGRFELTPYVEEGIVETGTKRPRL